MLIKTRIYSWFKSGNIGDILIAEQIQKIFEGKLECTFCDITSGEVVKCAELLPYRRLPQSIKKRILQNSVLREFVDYIYSFRNCKLDPFKNLNGECDLAIFAGGNSLMELHKFFPADLRIMYRRIKELKKQHVKVAFCFSGVGPFNCNRGKKLARRILAMTDFISVRDHCSYNICKKFCATKEIEIWRDPVLAYEPEQKEDVLDSIVINIYFGVDNQLKDSMRKAYRMLISVLRKKYPQYKICLFASETADVPDVEAIKNCFEDDASVIVAEIKSTRDIFQVYEKASIVIGTRMHSLITAIISDKTVVAISWQKKVKALMESLEYETYIISQENFCKTPEDVAGLVYDAMHMERDKREKTKQRINQIKSDIDKMVDQFVKRMESIYELYM